MLNLVQIELGQDEAIEERVNAQSLAEAGARPPDRWAIVMALLAEHGLLPPDHIGPDTLVLRKGMDLAAERG